MTRPGKSPSPGERGIGLIEFMIALLILTVVIAGTMALQLASLRTTTDSRISSAAISLAQSRLEELRSMSWTRFTTVFASLPAATHRCFEFDTQPKTGESARPPCTGFFRRDTVVSVTPPPESQGRRILVTVTWTGQAGQQQVVQSMDRMP